MWSITCVKQIDDAFKFGSGIDPEGFFQNRYLGKTSRFFLAPSLGFVIARFFVVTCCCCCFLLVGFESPHNPFISGTQFSGTQFSGTQFPGTQFSGTQFSGTQFLGTQFSGTQFPGTRFSGTLFSDPYVGNPAVHIRSQVMRIGALVVIFLNATFFVFLIFNLVVLFEVHFVFRIRVFQFSLLISPHH